MTPGPALPRRFRVTLDAPGWQIHADLDVVPDAPPHVVRAMLQGELDGLMDRVGLLDGDGSAAA